MSEEEPKEELIQEMQDHENEPLLEEREKETESLIREYNSGGL